MISQTRHRSPVKLSRPIVRVNQQMMDEFLIANFHKPRLEPSITNIADMDYVLRIERMFAEGAWVKDGDVKYEV